MEGDELEEGPRSGTLKGRWSRRRRRCARWGLGAAAGPCADRPVGDAAPGRAHPGPCPAAPTLSVNARVAMRADPHARTVADRFHAAGKRRKVVAHIAHYPV